MIQDSKYPHQTHLRLNSQNKFRVAIFSDLHFGEEENGWGIDQDDKSIRVMKGVLSREHPDLVVLSMTCASSEAIWNLANISADGDLITGENTFLENATSYVDSVVGPMVDTRIPWASTYGNHDEQFNLSREALFKQESAHCLSYTRHSVQGVPGVTNYFLPIFPHVGDKPVAILWFFDSEGGSPFQGRQDPSSIPNWVSHPTISWFQKTQRIMKQKWGQLPSIAFVHIPPTAFLSAQQRILPNIGNESTYYPGLNDDVPLDSEGDGLQDLPFMQALINTPKLHSIYSGHDHGNSWCVNWVEDERLVPGVSRPHLCFCKHTGYGGYGSWNRGSRVLQLTFEREEKKMAVQTWVRMENGAQIQHVTLNESYGYDQYPTDDGEALEP